MEARRGRDAAGGSMRKHDSAIGQRRTDHASGSLRYGTIAL